MKAYNPDAAPNTKPNIKSFHVLRPVPQRQIDRTAGSTFPQNPGY